MMMENATIQEEYFFEREGEQQEEEYTAVSIKSHRFNKRNEISYDIM